MTETTTWSESASATYRALAAAAVPRRAEQIATLLTLVPASPDEAFDIVEAACGEGLLGEALLTAFPRARYLGLDGSPSMLAESAARLARFGVRARTGVFALESGDWLPAADAARLVVSSLCVHHLDGAGKRRLFAALAGRLAPGGALLLADIVAPLRPEAADLYAATWDQRVDEQSRAIAGDERLLRRFRAEDWNHYRTPDPIDRPSPLSDQLLWLREAGFGTVDCFWLEAGHAIYGGYLSPPQPDAVAATERYDDCLRIARALLSSPERPAAASGRAAPER